MTQAMPVPKRQAAQRGSGHISAAFGSAVLTGTLLLCSCKLASPEPDLVRRLAGSWTMLHYTMAFDATGVTGGMVDLVAAGQASIGKKDLSGPICLTAAETGKDDLIARVSEAIRIGPEWKIDHADVKNGQVDLVATMDDKIAGRGTLKVTGSISPTFTDLLVTTDVWQPKPSQGHIHTVLKQENSRVGKCSN